MTATTLTAPPTHPAVRESASTKQLWKTGAIAGLVPSVATLAIAASAKALDGPIEVGGKAIPLLGFPQLTFVGAIIGTILAVVLSRRATHSRRTFVITTVGLTLLSIIPDALADAHTATKFTLALTHGVAAAIIIPALSALLA